MFKGTWLCACKSEAEGNIQLIATPWSQNFKLLYWEIWPTSPLNIKYSFLAPQKILFHFLAIMKYMNDCKNKYFFCTFSFRRYRYLERYLLMRRRMLLPAETNIFQQASNSFVLHHREYLFFPVLLELSDQDLNHQLAFSWRTRQFLVFPLCSSWILRRSFHCACIDASFLLHPPFLRTQNSQKGYLSHLEFGVFHVFTSGNVLPP